VTRSEPAPRATRLPDRGDPLLELPEIPERDPEELVQHDPRAPEGGLPCGRRDCDHIVGGPAAGLDPLATGFCANCGTRYSLEPQLNAGVTLDNGRYTVRGPVAHGGLGWVYLAVDHRLNDQYCALKGVLNSHDPEARDAILEERNQLVRLQHPSIVRIYDYVRHPPEGEPPVDYLVMDFVAGKSLGAIVRETRDGYRPLGEKVPLLLEHVARYGCQILAALQTLHGAGLVYCDLKPDNVIHSGRRVVLVDLGGVQREHEHRPGGAVFTPEYAPDETRSGRPPTVRHDIHALGATLRDLAAHAAPPGGRSEKGLAESFTRLVERACHPTPAARFASAAEMAEQLEGVLRELISLSDQRPVTKPSAVFASSHVLLYAGLGAMPGTGYWRQRPVRAYRPGGRFRAPPLADGRPTPGEVAVGLLDLRNCVVLDVDVEGDDLDAGVGAARGGGG
jgi:serine/threonine-protein kinase PknG